jgi:hypothetical protein
VSQTTVVLCHGDDRKPGCGEPIAVVNRGDVIRAGGGEILSYDRLGRARVACRCGAITITRGRTQAKVETQTAHS